MNAELIELTETWAARITICSNAETVCDGREVEAWQAEVTREAVDAGCQAVIDWSPGCESADTESFFAHWHGGKHYNATYRTRFVAAELYHREPEAIGEDDLTYGEWEWTSRKDTPRILQNGITAIVNAVDDAMDKALDAAEARIAEENRQFAEENKAD